MTTFLVSTVAQARVTQMLPACNAGGIAGLWPERLRRRLGTVKMYSISMTQQRLPFKIWIESLQYKTLVYKLGSLQENDLQCCSRKCVSINSFQLSNKEWKSADLMLYKMCSRIPCLIKCSQWDLGRKCCKKKRVNHGMSWVLKKTGIKDVMNY